MNKKMTTVQQYYFYMVPHTDLKGHCFYKSMPRDKMLSKIDEFIDYWSNPRMINSSKHIQRCYDVKKILWQG